MNLYAYVGNDPINATDPTGEFGIVGGIIGALGGAAVETVIQLAENGGDFSKLEGGRIARSAAIGGAIGATGGLAGAAVGGGLRATRGAVAAGRILNSGAGRVAHGAIQGSAGGAAGEVTAQIIDNGSVTDGGRVAQAAGVGAVAGGIAGSVGGAVHDGLQAAGMGRIAASGYSGGASGVTAPLGNPQTASNISNQVQAGVQSVGRSVLDNIVNDEAPRDLEEER